MKFTLNWLRDHLDTTAPLDEIAETLTAIGLEVESVTDQREALKPFVIAEIREAKPHPDAARLQICTVFDGQTTHQIVCGAANARAGLKVVMAPVGTVIPANGMVIKKAAIRGVESAGMLCSEEELGLADGSEGILELPADAPVGEGFAPWYGADDPVIDIAITPDRADCFGVRGVARDLAAAGLGTLRALPAPNIQEGFASHTTVTLADDGQSCRQFLGRSLRGVKNGPSPRWLAQRLQAVGLRPISVLVDVTNYISLDLGRPLHVYDEAKLSGGLTARLSRQGEGFLALNGKEVRFDQPATVIADEQSVHGIGGIMGGEESGCTESTQRVFLEVAWFDPIATAMAGRHYGIESDARTRFERGVDPAFLPDATAIATQMILELCGGEAGSLVSAGSPATRAVVIDYHPSEVEARGGVAVPESRQRQMLEALGFAVEQAGHRWKLQAPSWRMDMEGSHDVVEEMLRLYGYQHIPSTPLPGLTGAPVTQLPLPLERMQQSRAALASRGMLEVHSWSFLHHETAMHFGGGQPELRLLNPISSELDCMRPGLLPNLIAMAKRNMERGFDQIALCEVGACFASPDPSGQSTVAAGVRSGPMLEMTPLEPARDADLYDAKADVLAALAAAGAPTSGLQLTRETPSWYHPGRSGAFKLGKKTLAYFGELHPATLKRMDIKTRLVGFEVFLDEVPQSRKKTTRPTFRPSDLLPVERDFSFLMPENSLSGLLIRAIEGVDRQVVTKVGLISCYQNDSLKQQGQVSLALRVQLQPQEKTFTEHDIDQWSERIMLAALTVSGCRLSEALAHYATSKKMVKVLEKR